MKVTIITATYNSAATVGNCIKSVRDQSYPFIEHLIVDGNSKDSTIDKVRTLTEGNPNVIISSEPDKGIYDALNKGIAKATGDVIGFVHSDDFLADKDVITKIVNAFETKKVDGVYGNLHYVAHDNSDKLIRNWVSRTFDPRLLKRGWMPAHPTLYLSKSVYQTFGSFNTDYKIAADYDFILRIFKQENLHFYYLAQTIVKMRLGGASNGSLRNIIQKTKEDYRAAKTNKTGNWMTIALKNLGKLKQFLT